MDDTADAPKVVTLLFTDIEGSTQLWEKDAPAMQAAVDRHDRLLAEAVTAHRGRVIKGLGDGIYAVFGTPADALAAVVQAQRTLAAEAWPTPEPVKVRMGVHTGSAEERDGDYFGISVNRAARLMAIAHGGQALLSGAARSLLGPGEPEGVALVDLGVHRLAGLAQPEQVFQVCAPGLADRFPPLRSVPGSTGNLPAASTTLIGRDRELARVAELVTASRVVTVTGVGGVGKTRLAVKVAGDVCARHDDGAWLAELAPIRTPDGVEAAVANLFGAVPRPGETPAEAVAQQLRDKRLLLVLDNCEHVLGSAAELVDLLVRSCPGVTVLATSREALGVQGESVFPLAPLEVPGPEDGTQETAARWSVRLFVARAAAVRPGFTLTAANAGAVGEVCRRLDGIPLAIELAAARSGAIGPAELARRLDRHLGAPADGRRIARHQTLRAAIDWSYQLLSPAEQTMLSALSVFVGSWTLQACEEVAAPAGTDAFELLTGLVSKSLVAAFDDEVDETVYRLLETVRDYAADQLGTRDDAASVRTAHSRFYASWTEEAAAGLRTAEEPAWTRKVMRDQENIRLAMSWALESADVDTALRLLETVKQTPIFFLPVSGMLGELAVPAVQLPGAETRPSSAAALVMAATHAWGVGQMDTARRLSEEAEEAERRFGLPPDAYRLGAVALIAIGEGRIDAAIDTWALTIPSDLARQDRVDLGMDHTMVALYSTMAGRPGPWLDKAAEGLDISRATGCLTALVLSLANYAYILAAAGETAGREVSGPVSEAFAECFDLAAELGHSDGQAHGLYALAAGRAGHAEMAVAQAGLALTNRYWFPDRISVGALLGVLAAAVAPHQPATAAQLLGAFHSLHSGFGHFEHVRSLVAEADARVRGVLGDDEAERLCRRGAHLREEDALALGRSAVEQFSVH